MKNLKLILKFSVLLLICFALFLPRLLSLEKDWSSDEARWLSRSNAFIQGVFQGNFKESLQSYHPGVPTMWLGGIAIWTKYGNTLGIPGDALITKETLALARTGISVTTGCMILLIAYMLYRLYNTQIAFFSTVFLAFDPFFLAQSRRLHTDALVACFLTLTILALLIYLNKSNKKYVIISGICFGLSCLSKSTAIAVLPYILFLFILYGSGISKRLFESQCIGKWKYIVDSLIIWCTSAALVFLGLWPVFWNISFYIRDIAVSYFVLVSGILLLTLIWHYKDLSFSSGINRREEGITRRFLRYALAIGSVFVVTLLIFKVTASYVTGIQNAIVNPHNVPHLFWGRIIDDPGPFFYAVMLCVHSSPLILFLVPLGGFLLWDCRHKAKFSTIGPQYLILLSFIIFFYICMSIGAKKFTRYVLPICPFLDILAAFSLYVAIELIRANAHIKSYLKKVPILTYALVFIPVLGVIHHIYSVISLHPHYFSYINLLLTPRTVVSKFSLEDGQGLDPAAQYLNQKPQAEDLTVCVSQLGHERFTYNFVGFTLVCDGVQPARTYDYAVIYVRDLQIGWHQKRWNPDKLEKVIKINNIDYAWIYRV